MSQTGRGTPAGQERVGEDGETETGRTDGDGPSREGGTEPLARERRQKESTG